MTQLEQGLGNVAKMAAYINRLRSDLDALSRRGVRIPTLDTDPSPDDYTNIWFFRDGRLRWRVSSGEIFELIPTAQYRPPLPTFASDPSVGSGWRFWLRGSDGALRARLSNDTIKTFSADAAGGASDGGSPSAGGGTSTVAKPAVTRRYNHVLTVSANEYRCICPAHGVEGELYYGDNNTGVHGERRIMIGFDAAGIRSILTPQARVSHTYLRVTNEHAWYNSGVDIRFGAHGIETLGSVWSQTYAGVWQGHWPKSGGGSWRAVNNWIGYAFANGGISGLTIDQRGPSKQWYGRIRSDLQLRFYYSNTTP